MEQLNSKIYQKYTALKKQKLLDEGLESKREAEFKLLYDELKGGISELKKDIDELNKKLVDKEDEIEKARHYDEKITSGLEDWMEGTGRMEQLDSKFYQKYTALKKQKLLDEGLQPKQEVEFKLLYDALKDWTTELMKDNDELNKKLVDKEDELEKARQDCISVNGTDEIPSARMFHLLLQSSVRMKISVNDETEMFSASFCHEASGYSFTLTWLEEHGEWSYKLLSLGTLERIAVYWMRQDIRFSPKMCHMFFERISSVIRGGQHAL